MLLIGLIGVGNVAGRLFLGRIGDRMGACRLLACLTLVLAVLNGFWFCSHGFASLVVFAVLFGVANGGCISLYPAGAASWFGTANLGAILGALYIAKRRMRLRPLGSFPVSSRSVSTRVE